jgi:flagellar basal-body rod modification protein FlgD
MDVRHINSITGAGSPASARVATSLAQRQIATNKTTGTAKPKAAAASNDGTGSDSDSSDSSDITSSDFLTLLVSELKNQDPTQPADPNAYITQLVQVNSLQQLIQINQTGQLAGGDTVALLNDIDYTVDPSSTVATAPSTTSGAPSDPTSGSN